MRNPKAFPCKPCKQTKRVQSQLEPLYASPARTTPRWPQDASYLEGCCFTCLPP